MTNFSIGDLIEDKDNFLYFVLNTNLSRNTCTIVKKSGIHKNYYEYLNDSSTTNWDIRHTENSVLCSDFKIVETYMDQEIRRIKSTQ